ncbi:MAG: hypothetical protein GXO91_05075 [FCB group bacterium]|nr:hypothetical protein [FCB group bacterium]
MLTEKEIQFLNRRRLFISTWKTVAGILLSGLGLLLIGLFFNSPYLVNPAAVARALQEGSLAAPTVNLAALILPIVVLLLFSVIIIFILFGYSIISREKQYLSMIEKIIKTSNNDDANRVQT